MEEEDKSFFSEVKKTLLSLGESSTYLKGLDDILAMSTELNKSFLEGRTRIEQLQYAITDAAPGVVRLGGDISDVVKTIGDVAKETQRNMLLTEETVSELYAATQLLNTSADSLAEAFIDVGINIKDVGENLEESIYYVQSLGMNAREIVQTVVGNMDKLNRFQFEGGVQGLTKMAAQAAMLRVDMQTTFDFAEKVMTPEGAIEMAAAFQRLGVSAGDLVDPLAMLDKSLNDPTGLQDSLARVAQQFVSFSEEQGRFTISREGVLRLREMEEQAGITRGTLSKMGLAAAEMGKRMEQISMAGLTFKNEEDKQFLSNITTMGEGGVYQITLEDNTKVDLNKINQDQFDRLLQREKDRPKTLEDMQRAQMNTSDIIKADVRAIRDKIVYGVVTMGPIPKVTEEIRSVSTSATSALNKSFNTADIRGVLTGAYEDLKQVFTGPGDVYERLEKWEKSTEDKLGNMDQKVLKYFDKLTEDFKAGLRGSSANEMQLKDAMTSFQNQVLKPIESKLSDKYAGQSFLEGQQPLTSEVSKMTTAPGSATSSTQLTGNITMTINHTFPPELSKLSESEKLKLFDEYLQKQMSDLTFENYLKKIYDKSQPQSFPIKK